MDLHYPTVLSVKPKGLRITYYLIKLKKEDVMAMCAPGAIVKIFQNQRNS